MRLNELGEDHLIRAIAERFSAKGRGIIRSVGDDCSVTAFSPGTATLATVDALIEGVHFKRRLTPPYLLGRKSLSISLSDIAAMAGTPRFFLASIALPADTEKAYVYDVYRGLKDCAREFACPLVGGNTSRLPGRIMISTTVLGEAAKGSIVYRTGASPGDGVFVTGTTGDSALGLKVLAEYGEKALRGRFRRAVLKHLDPAPRLSLAKALAQRAGVSSMIDVSDGFLLDLKRLCRSSRVSAVVKGALMPVSDELRAYYGRGRKAVETLVLTGGEDYELVFTAPKGRSREIARVSKWFGVRITEVGEIVRVQKKAVRVFGNNGAELGFRAMGFEHF